MACKAPPNATVTPAPHAMACAARTGTSAAPRHRPTATASPTATTAPTADSTKPAATSPPRDASHIPKASVCGRLREACMRERHHSGGRCASGRGITGPSLVTLSSTTAQPLPWRTVFLPVASTAYVAAVAIRVDHGHEPRAWCVGLGAIAVVL